MVIVGSGAGGATMAAELAEAGVDVIVIEEGGYHPTESFTAGTGRALRTLYRDGGGGMAIGRPSVLFAEGRCVGGSTVVNGGMSWPTPERRAGRLGGAGCLGISERDLDPYFARAEARHSVGLQDPETIGRDSELLKAGAARQGLGRRPEPPRPAALRGHEQLHFGCPTGAKRSMLVTSVPRALAFGARLFADCRVDRITRAGRGGDRGHRALRPARRTPGRADRPGPGGDRGRRARSRRPALLARSGLRSASGQLGRSLSLHPNTTVIAFFDSDVTGWQGVHQAFQVREFMAEGILLSAQNLTAVRAGRDHRRPTAASSGS